MLAERGGADTPAQTWNESAEISRVSWVDLWTLAPRWWQLQAGLEDVYKEGCQASGSPQYGKTCKRQQSRDWHCVGLLAGGQCKGIGPVWCWLTNPPGAPVTLMQALQDLVRRESRFSDVLHCAPQSTHSYLDSRLSGCPPLHSLLDQIRRAENVLFIFLFFFFTSVRPQHF